MSLLEIRDLSIEFPARENTVKAVSHVSFEVKEGETFGIIGESGSGKSVIGLAVLRLLQANAKVSGEIYFHGQDVLSLKPSELRKIRGKQISLMPPQNPAGALNPVLKTGFKWERCLRGGTGLKKGRNEKSSETYETALFERSRKTLQPLSSPAFRRHEAAADCLHIPFL